MRFAYPLGLHDKLSKFDLNASRIKMKILLNRVLKSTKQLSQTLAYLVEEYSKCAWNGHGDVVKLFAFGKEVFPAKNRLRLLQMFSWTDQKWPWEFVELPRQTMVLNSSFVILDQKLPDQTPITVTSSQSFESDRKILSKSSSLHQKSFGPKIVLTWRMSSQLEKKITPHKFDTNLWIVQIAVQPRKIPW